MAKIKITKPERGETPEGGWYFTSYRMPVGLAQKLDRVAQKETKEQGTNISFSTATIRLLEHAIKEYGPTPGFKSELEATVLKKAAGTKKVAKAEKKAVTAKVEKKAAKKAEKKVAKKVAKAEKGKINIKLAKPVKKAKVEVEEEEEVEVAAPSVEETEEEVELSD